MGQLRKYSQALRIRRFRIRGFNQPRIKFWLNQRILRAGCITSLYTRDLSEHPQILVSAGVLEAIPRGNPGRDERGRRGSETLPRATSDPRVPEAARGLRPAPSGPCSPERTRVTAPPPAFASLRPCRDVVCIRDADRAAAHPQDPAAP